MTTTTTMKTIGRHTTCADLQTIALYMSRSVDHIRLLQKCMMHPDVCNVRFDGHTLPLLSIADMAVRAGGVDIALEMRRWLPGWLCQVRTTDLDAACSLETLLVSVAWFLGDSSLMKHRFFDFDTCDKLCDKLLCPVCTIAKFAHHGTFAAHVAAHVHLSHQLPTLASASASATSLSTIPDGKVVTINMEPPPVLRLANDIQECAVCGDKIECVFDDIQGAWFWKDVAIARNTDGYRFLQHVDHYHSA